MGRHKKECECDKCKVKAFANRNYDLKQPATESAAKAEFCKKESEQEEAELAAANESQEKTQ